MSGAPIRPGGRRSSARILNNAALLLLLAFALFLCQLINLSTFNAQARSADRLPVSIRAASQADYSRDVQAFTVPAIEDSIFKQVIMDIPATGPAHYRLATLRAALVSPVPTMTADGRLPIKATLTLTGANVSSTGSASTAIAFTAPTGASETATSTLASASSGISTATSPAAEIYTKTPAYTATVPLNTAPANTFTSTPTHTATASPTSAGMFTSTSTATSTATSTNTPTFTPTATWTPSIAATLSNNCVAYPTGGFVAVQDTWVDKTNPTASYGSDNTLKIRPTAGVDQRGLVKFDLSAIPPGSAIIRAALYLTVIKGDKYEVQLYPVTQPWTETTTWNTQPAYDATSAGSFLLTKTICTRVASFSTSLVSTWINDPSANFGIYLYPPTNSGQATFSSREGANPPVLVVEYQP